MNRYELKFSADSSRDSSLVYGTLAAAFRRRMAREADEFAETVNTKSELEKALNVEESRFQRLARIVLMLEGWSEDDAVDADRLDQMAEEAGWGQPVSDEDWDESERMRREALAQYGDPDPGEVEDDQ